MLKKLAPVCLRRGGGRVLIKRQMRLCIWNMPALRRLSSFFPDCAAFWPAWLRTAWIIGT